MASKDLPDIDDIAKQDLMAALGMLATGLAHEINTPLGAVRCTGSTLASVHDKLRALVEAKAPELAADPEFVKLVTTLEEGDRILQSSAERIRMLVGKIGKFARRECPQAVDFDLAGLIDDLLLVLDHELKHRIEVVRDYDGLPSLHGFPDPLSQILLNLILNAAQAIPERGRIEIVAAQEGDRVVIRVRDDGPGVPSEAVAQIFDFGFTTKSDRGGTGFGLALSRHLAAKIGGVLEHATPEGGGALFTLEFPRVLEVCLESDGPHDCGDPE